MTAFSLVRSTTWRLILVVAIASVVSDTAFAQIGPRRQPRATGTPAVSVQAAPAISQVAMQQQVARDQVRSVALREMEAMMKNWKGGFQPAQQIVESHARIQNVQPTANDIPEISELIAVANDVKRAKEQIRSGASPIDVAQVTTKVKNILGRIQSLKDSNPNALSAGLIQDGLSAFAVSEASQLEIGVIAPLLLRAFLLKHGLDSTQQSSEELPDPNRQRQMESLQSQLKTEVDKVKMN